MDVSTLLASAAVSAVVGTLVSVAAVSQVTVRRARAERADAARRAVVGIVSPLRVDIGKYRARMLPGLGREPQTAQMADYETVSRVLAAAADLPGWRRRLVLRRCRRVFGRYWTDLAELSPADPSSLGSIVAPVLVAEYQRLKAGADLSGRTDGLMHRALCCPPEDGMVGDLARELAQLAGCR